MALLLLDRKKTVLLLHIATSFGMVLNKAYFYLHNRKIVLLFANFNYEYIHIDTDKARLTHI